MRIIQSRFQNVKTVCNQSAWKIDHGVEERSKHRTSAGIVAGQKSEKRAGFRHLLSDLYRTITWMCAFTRRVRFPHALPPTLPTLLFIQVQ
jgi:hypothetical protein